MLMVACPTWTLIARLPGKVPCAWLGTDARPGFACFGGTDLEGSAFAALAAGGGKYLNVAESMPNATPGTLAQAIAEAGWCPGTNDPNCKRKPGAPLADGGYGKAVQADYNDLRPAIECLFPALLNK